MSARAKICYIEDFDHELEEVFDFVTATCLDSKTKFTTESVRGHSPSSVRRALANLTERCDCGNAWHEVGDG